MKNADFDSTTHTLRSSTMRCAVVVGSVLALLRPNMPGSTVFVFLRLVLTVVLMRNAETGDRKATLSEQAVL